MKKVNFKKSINLTLGYSCFNLKQIILLNCYFFTISKPYIAFTQTTYPCGVNGCIARWTFDSPNQPFLTSLTDLSGNNNNGTTYGIATYNGFRSTPLKAGAFDGVTSYCVVPNVTMLNPSTLSIVSLIKFNKFYNGLCQANNIVYKGFDYFNDVSWSMSVGETDGDCNLISPMGKELFFTGSNTSPYTPPLGFNIDSNKWYFLATTFDGSVINFYRLEMDSLIKASSISPIYSLSNPHPLGTTTHDVYIGATQYPTYPYWLNGSIDELVLFNRALSNAEIYSIYSYLWGWPNQVSNIENDQEDVQITCNQNQLVIQSNNSTIKNIDLFNLDGRKFFSSNYEQHPIQLPQNSDKLFIAKITFKNGRVISKKVTN